jgi:ligand-binding sensor domain-containing protein
MRNLWLPGVCGTIAVLGLTCSNPDKPHLVRDTVITVQIKVTAQIVIDSLLPRPEDIRRVELDIYRNGQTVIVEELDYREDDTKAIDPAHISGSNITVLAKAYTAGGDLVYFGYLVRPFINPDQACSLTIVLNWSLINARTAGLPDEYIYDVCVDRSGAVWAATDTRGVLTYDGMRWRAYTMLHGLPANRVDALLCDQADRIWAATPAGAACFDRAVGTWRVYRTADSLVHNQVQCLLEDPVSGAIWCGTAGGAGRFLNNSWTSYPALGNIVGMYLDNLGRLWCGTLDSGLKMMQNGTITTYGPVDGLPSSCVWSITQEGLDIWAGTSKGAAVFDGTFWTAYDGDRFDPDVVYTVAADQSAGRGTWFVTAWNVCRLTGTTWQQYQPVLDFLQLNKLSIDAQNYKWFSTTGNGIILYTGN